MSAVLIRPTPVTDAILTGSTTSETVAAWSAATTYAVDQLARSDSTKRIYKSVQGTNTNHNPTTDDGTWWVDVGPTNKWAMFDNSVGTRTTATTEFSVTLEPGRFGAIAFLDTYATAIDVEITDLDTSTVVYTTTISMESYQIGNWYDYLTAPLEFRTEAYLTGLPSLANPELSVRIYGSTGDTVECGVMVVGYPYELGSTQYGASVGILDYSKKDVSNEGVVSLVEGKFARKMDITLQCDAALLNRNLQVLSAVRAIPCVWVAVSDAENFEALMVFGWAREFNIVISYPTFHLCNLRIEGLT
jgi:hypothetical protein